MHPIQRVVSGIALGTSGLLLASGCGSETIAYQHAVLERTDGLEVLERSVSSPDTRGNELDSPTVGLPIQVRLRRSDYVLNISLPLQITPMMFFSATTTSGQILVIDGAYIHRVAPGSAAELDGYLYSFYFHEAEGATIRFTVRDTQGTAVGTEVLSYATVTRGYQTVPREGL